MASAEFLGDPNKSFATVKRFREAEPDPYPYERAACRVGLMMAGSW